MGTLLLIGLFAFRLLVWNPVLEDVELDPEEEALDMQTARTGVRLAHWGILLLFLALVLILIDQNQAYNLIQGSNLGVWLGTQFGSIWLVRLFLVAISHLNLSMFINMDNGRYELKGWEWWARVYVGAWFDLYQRHG